MGKIDTGVEHRMPVLPVISQACGEVHTRQKVFRRALQKSYYLRRKRLNVTRINCI